MKKLTPKNITTPAPEAAPVTAAEPMDAGVFGIHQVHQIRPSPDNRKRFNEGALQELAASIKSDGVAQPILIRPVLPTPDAPEHYEIVAGERRWRASVIAGNATIPAMVRPLTDLQAAKIRILENLQREDPHPLEEAEGYEQLMMRHGYNADQLADEIKKSRSYVYGRLKLCALSMDVREQFLDNKISASTALLIARIPVPALQARALEEITNPKNVYPAGEPLSYRRAAEHLQQRYMLDLATAIFPTNDAKLLAAAGACGKCPKRTGNQPEIFEDVKSADVCTDPDCFGEKKAAHYAKIVVLANKKGIPVLEGPEAKEVLPHVWQRDSELCRLDVNIYQFERNAPATKNEGTVEAHLVETALPTPAKYVKLDNGTVTALYKRSEIQTLLEKVGACETVEQHAARMAAKSAEPKGIAEQAALTAREEQQRTTRDVMDRENTFRIALYKSLRLRAANGLSLGSLREFVKLILRDHNDYSLPSDVLDVYNLDNTSDDAVCAYIDQANLPEVQLILVDLVLGECLSVMSWQVQDGAIDYEEDGERFDTLLSMARHEGIDPDAVREELFPTPLDLTVMKPGDLEAFIKRCPQRINELKSEIVQVRPDLVGALEKTAKKLGYIYSLTGFIMKPEEASDYVALAAPAVPEESPRSQGTRADEVPSIPSVKEQLQQQLAGKEKKPSAKKLALSPAAAWPFPRSRDDALAKDVEFAADSAPENTQPAVAEQPAA